MNCTIKPGTCIKKVNRANFDLMSTLKVKETVILKKGQPKIYTRALVAQRTFISQAFCFYYKCWINRGAHYELSLALTAAAITKSDCEERL